MQHPNTYTYINICIFRCVYTQRYIYLFVYIYTYIQTDTTSRARMLLTAQQPLQIHRDIYAYKFVYTCRHRGANIQIHTKNSHDLCAHMLLTVQ